MKRVALLPTGRTEWNGLPRALDRLFPGNRFYPLPTPQEVESDPDSFPAKGFTSNPLSSDHEKENPPEAALDLVARAAQAAIGDRHVPAADGVIIIDDLELNNANQPDRVTRVFRRAVELHLSGLRVGHAVTEKALRERVSFHLVVPMIESWFFGDPLALASAGLPIGRLPSLSSDDLEHFQTDDQAYLAATESDCPCWVSRGRKRKSQPKWLGNLPRALHPKGYLQWLCLDGAHRCCTTYDEAAGHGALEGIAWERLLACQGFHYLRALVADLAELLVQTSTAGGVIETAPPPTSLSRRPQYALLRNL